MLERPLKDAQLIEAAEVLLSQGKDMAASLLADNMSLKQYMSRVSGQITAKIEPMFEKNFSLARDLEIQHEQLFEKYEVVFSGAKKWLDGIISELDKNKQIIKKYKESPNLKSPVLNQAIFNILEAAQAEYQHLCAFEMEKLTNTWQGKINKLMLRVEQAIKFQQHENKKQLENSEAIKALKDQVEAMQKKIDALTLQLSQQDTMLASHHQKSIVSPMGSVAKIKPFFK